MTLNEMTGHEAGIIVFPGAESPAVAVYNWANCGDNQIPMRGPFDWMTIPWPTDNSLDQVQAARHVDDLRTELPGTIWLTDETDEDGTHIADTDMDIVSDDNGDLLRLFLGCDDVGDLPAYDPQLETTGATIYVLDDGTKIIAPDDWA